MSVHHALLLKQLINGRIPSNFLIINDTGEFSGLPLTEHVVREHLSRGNRVHFLWYEYHHEPGFLKEMRIKFPGLLETHDFFKDPLNLFKTEDSDLPLSFESLASSLISKITEDSERNVIVLDSILYPVGISSLHSVCKTLNRLLLHRKSKNGPSSFQIVAILHSDVSDHESQNYKCINSMACTRVDLEGELGGGNKAVMVVTHKKPRGKILKETYSAWLESDGRLCYEELKNKLPQTKGDSGNKIETELELTTFRLSLKQEEIESRKKVVLPYLRKSQAEERGKIYYEPDANDDWDDEDPDDDLEI